jgi:hypothetical protein
MKNDPERCHSERSEESRSESMILTRFLALRPKAAFGRRVVAFGSSE